MISWLKATTSRLAALGGLVASLASCGELSLDAGSSPSTRPLGDNLSGVVGTADILYVTDNVDNTVKRFDAQSGNFLDAATGSFVAPGSGGLLGPRGIVFGPGGDLLVNNDNHNLNILGEVLRYDGTTGAFQGALVPTSDPNAPFTPDGIIVYKGRTLFVADTEILPPGGPHAGCPHKCPPGQLLAYDVTTGSLISRLTVPKNLESEFHPRGVVLGPDGLLYVSTRRDLEAVHGALGGHILRFDPDTFAFLGSFIDSNPTNDMQRPDGLVFSPDGNIYVTSFVDPTNPQSNDKILIFDGKSGRFIGKIDLDQPGFPRSFAQALVFGPGGALFVPIFGNGPDSGEVRRCDVSTGTCAVFVPPSASGGPVGAPWGLTFGCTDPATLAYHEGC